MSISDINIVKFEPIRYIDVSNPDEIYIGISNNGTITSKSHWQIKRIIKINNIWYTQYPNGDQRYSFIWNNRSNYTYK